MLKPLCLITAKPAMFVGNVAEDGFDEQPATSTGCATTATRQHAPVVAICAKTEAELADMTDEDRLLFLHEMGQDEPGLNRLIRAAFEPAGAADLLHRRRRRKCVPGRSTSATPHRRPPA